MNERIRVMVVDDEPIARRTLRLLIAADPDLELVAECDGVAALERIAEDPPDLLFLDVEMPEIDGFALLEKVGLERVPAVVFVTAYDQHALRAFEVDAADYLLKPFDDQRFAATLRRVKASLAQQRAAAVAAASGSATADAGAPAGAADGSTPDAPLRRLLVPTSERMVVVPVEQIEWIEAADYYVRLHVVSSDRPAGKPLLLRQSLAELERLLDPARFFRLHRSAIANLDRVRELLPSFRGQYVVVLQSGTRVRLGRGRLAELQRRLMR